jgi:hypothetical protein
MEEQRKVIEFMEQNDIGKNRRIKILQEENHRLTLEIEEKSFGYSLRESEVRVNLDETVKICSTSSVASSIHSHHFGSLADSYEHILIEDRSFMSERMDEMSRVHRKEIDDLKSHYEKRIMDLREIYERELELPHEIQYIEREPSVRSRSYSRKSINQQDRKSSNGMDTGLYLNLKDMYSI